MRALSAAAEVPVGEEGRMIPVVAAVLFLASGAAEPRAEKMERLLFLEDHRTAGAGELDRYLRDADKGVRRRAALAAGRVGDPATVPALADLMNDGEPAIRQMAAFALGLVGDKLAVDRLVAALQDPDPTVRARSAEALGRIGDARAAPAVAQMVQAAIPANAPLVTVRGDDPGNPRDPWLELRLGLFALARLKDPRVAQSVLLSSGKPRFDWWAATWTAMRLESAAMKRVLVAAASSTDPLSRAYAARGLGSLKDASDVPLLSALSKDPEEIVAVDAIRALAALGDAQGVPAVAAALSANSPTLQWEALTALATLPPDRSLRTRVVGFVGDKEPWIRAAALRALAHLDRDDFALVLSSLDPDPDPMVRAALASALGDAGGEVAVGILFTILKEDDPRVVPAALTAMRKARGSDAAETLKRYLDHRDFVVRATAIDELGQLKVAGLASLLSASYQRALGDREIDARMAIVGTLSGQKDDAARALLRTAAQSDPSRVVRRQAAKALEALGETAPDPGPERADRPPLDYREAMAPYDPIPGVPLYTPRAIVYTALGRIEIHLDVVNTPLTTRNFIELAQRGFFDGLTFHRVVPGFVVQGGDPRGDGNGGPGYTIRCELSERPYGRGAVGMALAGRDTGGSQFFITVAPTPRLDGEYTLFGVVGKGMDVVDRIRPGDVIERVEIWDGR
jgi:cyclophilin family peptidyl-prolyl cis-trans isomerase/HEAT repeat protein